MYIHTEYVYKPSLSTLIQMSTNAPYIYALVIRTYYPHTYIHRQAHHLVLLFYETTLMVGTLRLIN